LNVLFDALRREFFFQVQTFQKDCDYAVVSRCTNWIVRLTEIEKPYPVSALLHDAGTPEYFHQQCNRTQNPPAHRRRIFVW
jgi:hypothetical protein